MLDGSVRDAEASSEALHDIESNMRVHAAEGNAITITNYH